MTTTHPFDEGGAAGAPVRSAIAAGAAWRELHAAAAAPYRRAGRFAWHFARGKLAHDPVFRALIERGWLNAAARVVDIGCGQGLLASLLDAAADQARRGRWPAAWAAAPALREYTGIELMAADVQRAKAALAAPQRTFVPADMRDAALPPCDAVVILDSLHYVDHDAQAALLARVHEALAPGGRLLLRIGDAAARRGFLLSQWVDRVVARLRGHRAAPTWTRTLGEWTALVAAAGFAVQCVPMSRGTPFANVLLVAERTSRRAGRPGRAQGAA